MYLRIRFLGKLFISLGWIAASTGLLFLLAIAAGEDPSRKKALEFFFIPVMFLCGMVAVPCWVAGLGIVRRWKWSRVFALMVSLPLFLLIPIGTALAAYAFALLNRREADGYFDPAGTHAEGGSEPNGMPLQGSRTQEEETLPEPTPPPSPGAVLTVFTVGAGFFLVIKIGFVLSGDSMPAPIANPAATVVAAIIFAIGIFNGLRAVFFAAKGAQSRQRVKRKMEDYSWAHKGAKEIRAAELRANPATAKYAERVEQGEHWSDEKIAYDQDRTATKTCSHLKPIEAAMRQAGVPVEYFQYDDVKAKCLVLYSELRRKFKAGPPLRYSEYWMGERDDKCWPVAYLICDQCQSSIHTLHPESYEAESARKFPE